MHSQHVAVLGGARLLKPLGLGGQAQAPATNAGATGAAGANCITAMPEASSTFFGWYRPRRLLSQVERIPI